METAVKTVSPDQGPRQCAHIPRLGDQKMFGSWGSSRKKKLQSPRPYWLSITLYWAVQGSRQIRMLCVSRSLDALDVYVPGINCKALKFSPEHKDSKSNENGARHLIVLLPCSDAVLRCSRTAGQYDGITPRQALEVWAVQRALYLMAVWEWIAILLGLAKWW